MKRGSSSIFSWRADKIARTKKRRPGMRFSCKRAIGICGCVTGMISLSAVAVLAQSGGGGATVTPNFHNNYHLGFDRPEAWGLKYFASASMLSGLQPPDPA